MCSARVTPPSTVIVTPAGELDLATVGPVTDSIDDALDAHGQVDHIVFDLTDVSFIDSSGAKAIILAARRMRSVGGQVSVCNAPPPVHRVLELIGVGQLATLDAARDPESDPNPRGDLVA